MDNATKYEVLNKVTGEVLQVTGVIFGDEIVTVSTAVGDITFFNKDKAGDLQNEEYSIREVGTHVEADGVGVVEDIPSLINLGVETE